MYSYHAAGTCLSHAFHKLGSGDICHSRECARRRQRHVDIFGEESTNTKSQKVSQEEGREKNEIASPQLSSRMKTNQLVLVHTPSPTEM